MPVLVLLPTATSIELLINSSFLNAAHGTAVIVIEAKTGQKISFFAFFRPNFHSNHKYSLSEFCKKVRVKRVTGALVTF